LPPPSASRSPWHCLLPTTSCSPGGIIAPSGILETGDAAALRPFLGAVISTGATSYALLTDLRELERRARLGVLDFETEPEDL
jgi:hypothetical protein